MTNGQHPTNQPSAHYFTPVPPPRPTTPADTTDLNFGRFAGFG
ncbi:hypothetical protein EDC02_3469 [Micromonospora sp. Llam0]|nr:hypothetical protein EDC02_3469 [Micromonospora sp. Llam0]